MAYRVTSFNLPEDLYKRIRICAGTVGLTPSQFIRGACEAGIAEMTQRDESLRLYLECIGHWTRAAESVRA